MLVPGFYVGLLCPTQNPPYEAAEAHAQGTPVERNQGLVRLHEQGVRDGHSQDVGGDDVIPTSPHLVHPEGRDVQE